MPETVYDPPAGPPPNYGYSVSEPDSSIHSPAPAHVQPNNTGGAYAQDNYNGYASPNTPYQALNRDPNPNANNNRGYAPQGGYYAPGPQMGYAQQGPPQQGGYYGQPGPGPYGPQGGYHGGPGYGPGYGGYGRPQGQYLDDRRGASDSGFMEAMLASLACCCCLDACLLF